MSSKFENYKYRYLTDIKRFSIPFMAHSVTIHPKQCANDVGSNSAGCGVRWEILGSSTRLGRVFIYCCFQNIKSSANVVSQSAILKIQDNLLVLILNLLDISPSGKYIYKRAGIFLELLLLGSHFV